QVDANLLSPSDGIEHAAHDGAHPFVIGQLHVEVHGQSVDVFRQLDRLAGDDHRGARRRQLLRQLAQRPRDVCVRKMGADVFEEVDGVGVLDPGDVFERRQWILRHGHMRSMHAREAARDRPFVKRQTQIGGDFIEQRVDALLFHRLDGDERMEREDQPFEVVNRGAVRHRGDSVAWRNRPRPEPVAEARSRMNKKKVLDEIRVFILMLLVISSLRSALADWNDVPTGSMKPTIQEGDRVVVNKLAYDLKVPFTTIEIWKWDNPKRGDIVVLFSPVDGTRLVKRVVAIPGDTISMTNNQLFVNNKAVPMTKPSGPFDDEEQGIVFVADEVLAGKLHKVMFTPQIPARREFGPDVIPAGKY